MYSAESSSVWSQVRRMGWGLIVVEVAGEVVGSSFGKCSLGKEHLSEQHSRGPLKFSEVMHLGMNGGDPCSPKG